MDRLDLEQLAERMIDHVQVRGVSIVHDVADPAALRHSLRGIARARAMLIRTGTANSEPATVWAMRPDEVLAFTNPVTEEDEQAVADATSRALRVALGE